MRLHVALLIVSVCSLFGGCTAVSPVTAFDIDDQDGFCVPGCELEGKEAVKGLARLARTRPVVEESSDEPLDLSPFPTTHSPIATRILAAKTPRGAFVHLIDDRTGGKWIGTVQSVDSERMILNDCLFSEALTGPHGEREAAASFVRALAIDIAPLTHMTVFSVPSRKDEAHFLCDRGRDDVIREFLFVSGRSQPVSGPPPVGLSQTQSLSQVALGSRIGWRDATDVWWEGTLIARGSDAASIQDCACRSMITRPDGGQQAKTSLIRSESVQVSGLTDVIVMGPPAHDSRSRQGDEQACDHCLDGIVLKSGRRINIHLPTNDNVNARGDSR